ncbi:MAG: DUF11 domain-containing protein, partial [Chloroflexi bacterium]|nr:DUF11 domain-containing protein [Chloroflexota bacterium]
PTPTPAPSPTPDPSQGNRVVISTTVSPSSVTPGQFTTFTYTLLIENVGTSRLHLEQIGSLLPPGFVYVPGSISSTGIQTSQGALVLGEPTVTMVEGRAQHVWDFGTPLPWLESGATARVGLQAAATPLEGTYSSEAWVRVSAEQLGQVSTGEAGAVVAAWPQLDITASSGRVRLLVRAKVQDTDVVIVSWQVE